VRTIMKTGNFLSGDHTCSVRDETKRLTNILRDRMKVIMW
jgi:hypothetical protein